MKPLLLLGAALMAGASVYGIMDYRKKTQSESFNQLYRKKAASGSGLAATGEWSLNTATPDPAGNETAKTEKKQVEKIGMKKKAREKKETPAIKIERRMFSRGPLEEEWAPDEDPGNSPD